MYWKNNVLQDIYPEYVENEVKMCNQTKRKADLHKGSREQPTYLVNLRTL